MLMAPLPAVLSILNCASRNPLLDGDTVKCLINSNTPCLRNDSENDQFVNISFILQSGEEKDTDRVYARNTLQSTALIPKTLFNYVTFLFQNMKQ